MKTKLAQSFDELIRNYYGRGSTSDLRDVARVGELFARYYGARTKKQSSARPAAVTMSVDDGEVLKQNGTGGPVEYVIGQSVAVTNFEEYILGSGAVPGQSTSPVTKTEVRDPIDAIDAGALRESQVDVLQPLRDSGPASPVVGKSAPTEPVSVQPPAYPVETGTSQAKSTDDEFIADMQSILSGQKVFDPVTRRTTDKETLRQAASGEDAGRNPAGQDVRNRQAIFDQIAQTMQYANAYDLGTVELENRFTKFDELAELQQKAAETKKAAAKLPDGKTSSPSLTVDSEDFLKDLEAIRKERGQADISSSQSTTDDYSRPLFDTGEHVLTGGDHYPDRLRVGKPPGVLFSYGQIIAMGDLYENVDQMMAAPVSELERLKALIGMSTMYYKKKKADPIWDVADDTWDDATGGRYLDLAEVNYEHFSPAAISARHGTNKSEWEKYHKRAIEAAQRAFLNSTNSSPFPEEALIVNAFGDHFLTDAFAAGHLINKEAAMAAFKMNFFDGKSLRPAGAKFFEKVANRAFRGEVRKKFEVLETYNPKFLWWNPNIDTVNAFRKLLLEAADKKPDAIANIAVKALHDKLNREGIEVMNDAGDAHWLLKGDGNLIGNVPTIDIIKRAVNQSIANINDPSIRASNLNFATYFAKVWKHVPRPMSGSKKLAELQAEYTDPNSDVLALEAADIITHKVDSIIKKLLKEKYLKYA